MARFCALLLCTFMIAPMRAQPPSASDVESARRLLKQSRLPTEGKGLLEFFRERTLSKEQVAELSRQAKALASDNFAERQKATAHLLKAGALSRELLRAIVKKDSGSTLETVRRAEKLLAQIAAGQDRLLAIASARLIAHQPPPQSGQTLLDFMPFATDVRLLEEVQRALNVLAVKDGAIAEPFLAALKDRQPARRAAAGAAIIHAGGPARKDTVAPLLADESPQVRLAVISALVEAQDKYAIPALIDLLPVVSKDKVWQVEYLLQRIANEKAPDVHVGAKTSAKLAQVIWKTWWQTNQQTVSLAKLNEPPKYRGFYVLVQNTQGPGGSKVMEVRPSKKVPWQYNSKRFLTDGQYKSPQRVLVAEGRQLYERDLQGNSYWETEFDDGIIGIQRLARGDIFVATRRQLYLLDSVGLVVFSPKIQKVDKIDDNTDQSELVSIAAAGLAPDGYMVYANQNGECTWLDPDGLVARSFKVGPLSQGGAGIIDVLPGQSILLPLADKVAEFDGDGKMTWHVMTQGASSALRLPNGNTLVARGRDVAAFDRDGREVWSFQAPGNAVRVRKK